MKVEKNTHFEVKDSTDIIRIFQEHEARFDDNLDGLMSKFKNKKRFITIDDRGQIDLNLFEVNGSTRIPNPFHDEVLEVKTDDIEVEVEEVEIDITDRLSTIETLNEFIGLEVDSDLLKKLILVLDSERTHGKNITLDTMLKLKDECQTITS